MVSMDFKELLDTPLNDFIKHSAKGSTWEKEDHKYIAKIPIPRGGGRNQQYRYFYDMNELLAYMKTMPWSELQKYALSFGYSSTSEYGYTQEDIQKMTEDNHDELIEAIIDRVLYSGDIPTSIAQLNKKNRAFTSDEDFLLINEYYGTNQYGYWNNCASCTAAYDMRRRGYDVIASGISTMDDNPTPDEILSWYNGAKIENADNNSNLSKINEQLSKSFWDGTACKDASLRKEIADKLRSELKSEGEGARGHLITYWVAGGGHSVVFEVENDEVIVRDCQSFKKINLDDWVGRSVSFSYIRTDNVEVNDNILDRVENRTGIDRGATTSRMRTSKGITEEPGYRNNR